MHAASPHALQRHALAALHQHSGDQGRAVVVMPCGSGKTLLGRWFAEQTAARLTVVFVPSLALVGQTVAAYRAGATWRHDTMIVCSDPTTGRAVTLDALAEQGLPDWARSDVVSSTSQRAVADFAAGPGPRLVVSTYHSAPKLAGGLAAAGRTADLVVCDEAHRLAGRPRREFRAVLDDQALPARRRVFLTATPVEAAAWAAGHDDDAEPGGTDPLLALDDETVFGPRAYEATFADAVAAGRLVDYDVEVLAPREPDLADTPNPRTAGQLEATLRACEDGATRVLTFHGRVNGARTLAAALDGHTLSNGRTVRAEHVEARHRAPRRAAALARLAHAEPGVVRVLCSARTLSEGVDVPAVDTVVFADPRSSTVDVVQAVGRAMRTAPGKTRGRIVLAAAPDRAHDDDTALAGTAWAHVWTTLRALASMDDRFAARLRHRAGGTGPGGYRGGPVFGAGPALVMPDVACLDRWLLRCLDKTGLGWWVHYDALAAWAATRGHARPQPRHTHDAVRVGAWAARQRTAYRAGQLVPAKVDALEQLPGWSWDSADLAWWAAHTAWTEHRAGRDFDALSRVHGWPGGHPSNRPARAFPTLADFAVTTAARRRRGDLPAHLEHAAEKLPGWRWNHIPDADGVMADALREYGAWRGDHNPPHDYVQDGPDGELLRLGAWLTAIRRRRATGRLDPALERELDALTSSNVEGRLRWDTADTTWRLGLLALHQYVAREKTCRISWQHVEKLPDHELDLSRWCVVQRQRRRAGQLTPERAAALEEVPGWAWEVTLRDGYEPDLADGEHGLGGYERGCRCARCIEAHGDYRRVPARKARGHVLLLLGRGAGQKPIARAAKVNPKTIGEIVCGHTTSILPTTESALLALTLDDVLAHTGAGRYGGYVDAAETWRLIDEITALGWPKAWISREIGGDGRALQLRRDRVGQTSADWVAEVHRRLRGRPAPPRATGTTGKTAGWMPLPTLDDLDAVRTHEAVAS